MFIMLRYRIAWATVVALRTAAPSANTYWTGGGEPLSPIEARDYLAAGQ